MRKSVQALALLAAVSCGDAAACDCTRILDRASAGLVFEGVPHAQNLWLRKGAEPGDPFSAMVRFTFSVHRILKGRVGSFVIVESDGSDCGIHFKPGQSYRVYAYSQPDLGIQWAADRCSKTIPIGKPHRKKP